LKLAVIVVIAMPTILFILLLALVIFGPKKLLHVATNTVPTQHPWEKLMSLMTGSVSADTEELCSQRSRAESPKSVAEPLPSLATHLDRE
jgi:Sec-independent protein translocase protein TatA